MDSNININYTKKPLPARFLTIAGGLTLIGIAIYVLAYLIDYKRAAFNNTIGFMFIYSIGAGSLFLVALEYLIGAVWSTPFRRISEFLSASLFLAPLLVIPLLLNMHDLFHWTHKADVASDELLSGKVPYLNENFFIIRTVAAFVIMWLFYYFIAGKSQKQDKTGDYGMTKKILPFSAIIMPFMAITLTYMAMDWMMSLEPHWFSTIFGVYYFAGTVLAALAMLTLLALYTNENGLLPKGLGRDHYYNFGALMFAFINFWAYIAFSQFMLIWYANLPEETFWFIDRMEGGWAVFSIGLVFIHFIVPYALLLSRPSKSDPKRLKIAAVWILFAHYYDLYFLIMPTYSHSELPLSWTEFLMPILPVGLVMLAFALFSRNKNFIPVSDPKLKRGMDFHL